MMATCLRAALSDGAAATTAVVIGCCSPFLQVYDLDGNLPPYLMVSSAAKPVPLAAAAAAATLLSSMLLVTASAAALSVMAHGTKHP
jgi:hypothetical protein